MRILFIVEKKLCREEASVRICASKEENHSGCVIHSLEERSVWDKIMRPRVCAENQMGAAAW